ncbi:MAG: DUF748 domain-containing protein [Colwellia sp.]|nr:DUF748 domain-containing protein [Colwellia sp.]
MNTSALDRKPTTFLNKLLKITAITVLSLYLIIWAISSPVSKYLLTPILLEQGLSLSADSSISYNPFLSQISIRDLTLFKAEKYNGQQTKQYTVLSIEQLTIRLTLVRLLFDEIKISKFELNNAYLKIEKNVSQLIIAGIDVIDISNNTEKKPAQAEDTEPTPFLYQLILPKLALTQVNIDLAVDVDVDSDQKFHQINIKELLIDQLKASQHAQQATLSLQSFIDNTAFDLSLNANFEHGQGEINSKLSMAGYAIKKLQPYIGDLSELSGTLSLTSEQQITIAPQQFKLHINKAKLSNKNLVMAYQQQFFELKSLENLITDLKLTLHQGQITELSGASQLTLHTGDLYYQQPSQKLAHFEQLALNEISFHFVDTPQIKISSLIMDNFYGSKHESSDLPALVSLKQFNISDIVISEQQLSFNEIILNSLQGEVILDKEKSIANLVTLPITTTENATEEQAARELAPENVQEITQDPTQVKKAHTTDFIISLNEFSLINNNQISLLDNSVEPVYQRELFIDTLHLGALSNAKNKQEQQTPFALIGRSNKYAHFSFKGFTQPFAQQPKHHLQGFLKELSLPAVSTYMKQAMQMELKSGQLNTDIDVTLTGEQLDGNVVILLQGLETAIANSDEAGALIDQGALPFNIALGMLKDSRGNVELDVPLSGSTSDPQFGISSIVSLITKKAIWMATQDYLMTTFVPYANIVSVAMTVGEFALKLRFDDLIYQSKQIEPNDKQQAYLQAFIGLMQDKEDTRINICAISTPADLNLDAGSQVTDKKHIRQLKAIGEQREEAFKEYMIKHGNIASSRLLLCAPKIDSSEGAQPRIELSV